MTGLLDRHLGFVEALRRAGVAVSLAEDIDALDALAALSWEHRETVRAAYAATLLKRHNQRITFDTLFDLWYPPRIGHGWRGGSPEDDPEETALAPAAADDGPALADLRRRLGDALAAETDAEADAGSDTLATEAMERFGSMPGRGPSLSSWSAYTALRRVDPGDLVDDLVAALQAGGLGADTARRVADRRVAAFSAAVEADARRRIAEERGPRHVADTAVRPALDRLDFLSARRDELDRMRREIHPLARRLAARLTKEQHARRRGPLDVRRTVRASISTGGVPLTTYHRPRRPHRTDLVVLCDVSGSVAHFAQFTLLLVFALRDQFSGVRAFTFVDDVVEVTEHFRPGADAAEVLDRLTASAAHAARFGRTNYGRALEAFEERHGDALGPRSSLLVLGDARSNYSDLHLARLREMVAGIRHAWWLNPEHRRHWDTGDSAAGAYGAIVPMVECRNLVQLGEFVHDLV